MVEQVYNESTAYHGYWAANFFAPNPAFGTDDDLKTMISEAHKRDIWVMVDVVYNHVGQCKGGDQDFSCQITFPKAEYYHKLPCTNDWDCRLAGLPDLNQSNSFVNDTLISWAQWLITNYNFDGFRVDTVKWIDHEWWKILRPFTPWYNVGEVWDVTYERIAAYMNPQEVYGALNYPLSCRNNDAFYNSGNSLYVFGEYFN